MAGDIKNPATTDRLATPLDATDPLAPLTAATKDAAAAVAQVEDAIKLTGAEIIRLDAAAAPIPQSQHPKLRVRWVIPNIVTAGAFTLNIGTVSYPFDLAARDRTPIPFPIVIERGVDMSFTGADGRCYLIGDPE